MTEFDQQVAAHTCSVCAERGPVVDPVILTHTQTHTECPRMHIESTDPLWRPGQRCFQSSVALGSPRSHNCGDRIGSEMRVGLKIEPLFLK